MTAILFIYSHKMHTCVMMYMYIHIQESVLCKYMKRCLKIQPILALTLDLHESLHLFPNVSAKVVRTVGWLGKEWRFRSLRKAAGKGRGDQVPPRSDLGPPDTLTQLHYVLDP